MKLCTNMTFLVMVVAMGCGGGGGGGVDGASIPDSAVAVDSASNADAANNTPDGSMGNPDTHGLVYTGIDTGVRRLWATLPDGTGGWTTTQLSSASKDLSGGSVAVSPVALKVAFATDLGVLQLSSNLSTADTFALLDAVTLIKWSPNGSRLLVRNNQTSLVTLDPSGIVPDYLGETVAGSVTDPRGDHSRWSPDSTRVAFLVDPDGDDTHRLFTVDADGTNLTDVTPNLPFGAQVVGFRWSHDSTRLLARVDRVIPSSTYSLRVAAADGSGDVEVSIVGANVTEYAWSHDSSRIAYVDGNTAQVHTVLPTGAGDVVLGDEPFAWSPTANQIAYSWTQLSVANADGSAVVDVSAGMSARSDFAWSPDGTRLAFRAGTPDELYVVDTDGGNLTKASATLVPGGQVSSFRWGSPETLMYGADSVTVGVAQLHVAIVTTSPTAGPSGTNCLPEGPIPQNLLPPGYVFSKFLDVRKTVGSNLVHYGAALLIDQNDSAEHLLCWTNNDGSSCRRLGKCTPTRLVNETDVFWAPTP